MAIAVGVTEFGVAAQGQLANAEASIYVPGAGEYARNVALLCFNKNSTAETVTIMVKKSGGTSREVAQFIVEQNGFFEFRLQPGLGPSDDLRVFTTTASQVNYTVLRELVT